MVSEAMNNTNPELDASAVKAVRHGDAERYRELVERYERRVYAVAWSRLGDAALAEEATQELLFALTGGSGCWSTGRSSPAGLRQLPGGFRSIWG